MEHIYVSLEKDEDGYPPYDFEELDATPVGGDRYRIEGIPVFTYGLARGDIVRVTRFVGDMRLWAAEWLENSGHWTSRVITFGDTDKEGVVTTFTAMGCDAYVSLGLVAIDVPPDVAADDVMEELRRGRSSGAWDFDVGVRPGE